MHTRTHHRRLRLGLPALLLGLLVALLPALPAQAHDRLTSSDPTSGASLESAPKEVELTFSADVQDVGGSVELVDGDGKAVSTASPVTEGSTVTTAVEDDLAAGDYTVRWRVVSSDGHAISGVIDFTVEEDAAASSSSSESPSAGASGTATESAGSSDEASTGQDGADASDSADEDSGPSVTVLLLGAAGVVIVLAAVAALIRSRRRADS